MANVVYVIRHPATGVFYIGSTNDVIRRKWEHTSKLRRNVHENKTLQWAWDFDGEFTWEEIPTATREEAHALEQKMIKEHYGSPMLVNRTGAQERTAEHSEKIAAQRRGRKESEETKRKLSALRKGKKKSLEWVEKMKRANGTEVSVDGVVYCSAQEVGRVFGIHVQTVINRIKQDNWPTWFKVTKVN